MLGFEYFDRLPIGIPPPDPRRAIVIMGNWDEQRAREREAVYFCSTECQDEYVSMWYRDEVVMA